MSLKKLLIRIGADSTELDKKVLESSKKLEQVGKRLNRMGRSLSLNVTAPLVGFGVVALRSSIQFEDAMAGVAKTVDESAEVIAGLGDEFKNLSEQIPVAAVELANIGEAAGQLGIKTANILKFSRVMADLGVATNLTSTEAAKDLARLANITQMPQDAFDRLGSVVVELGNNLATTEQEIVSMGLRLAGAGTQLGLTEAQILALGGALSSVGIEAEAGGTAFSKVMAEMAIAAGEGGKKLEQFGQIAGMTGAEFAKAFEEDAAEALVTFIEGIGRLSAEGVNVFQVLESVEFGNIRVRDALLRASSAGDLMRRSLDLGSQAWRENTALTIEAEKFYATLGNQLKIAWNEVVNMAAEVGDELKPAMLALIDVSKPVLRTLRDMIRGFSELPPFVQASAIGLAGLTAAAGPAVVVLGQLAIAVGALRGAAALGGLAKMGRGSLVVAALVGLSALYLRLKGRVDEAAESQRAFANATQEAAESQEIASARIAVAMADKRLGAAERNLLLTPLGDREQLRVGLDRVKQFKEELKQASEELERLQTGGVAGVKSRTGFDVGGGADKQAALAKQLQDRLVAMTKTAVDDMELEYDRLEAHILAVDGTISEEWRKVLDGMSADIAKVGLAEESPVTGILEDMNKATAKADQLEASLGRRFDLVSAKVAIFRGALEEMIDLGLGPANEEYERTLDVLKRLLIAQGKMAEGVADLNTELSFFEGLKEQAGGILDPSAIASSALGNLLSGGVSTLLSTLGSTIGDLFGQSEQELALVENTKALHDLTTRVGAAAQVLGGTPGGLFGAGAQAIRQPLGVIADTEKKLGPGLIPEVAESLISPIIESLGFSFSELDDLAKRMGINWLESAATIEQFADTLAAMDLERFFEGFTGQMNLAQRRFDLFDIQAPAEKLSVLQDLFEQFTNLPAPTNTEEILELFERFSSGALDIGDLDKLTGSQFLDMLGDMEGLFDDLGDSAEGANAALRNVPAGFKIAAARFRATDPEQELTKRVTERDPTQTKIGDTGGGGLDDAVRGTITDALAGDFGRQITDALAEADFNQHFIFQGDINLPDVQDADEFLRRLEERVEWRARTGTSIIQTTTQR